MIYPAFPVKLGMTIREILGQARNEEREARNEALVKHGMREGLWQEMIGHAFALWGFETWPTRVYG